MSAIILKYRVIEIQILFSLIFISAGVALLWVLGPQIYSAGILVCTMIGDGLAHLDTLGSSTMHALILGTLAAIVAYVYRDQISHG